jgi:tetratricopeptide (TPR) repeat protein/predicted Ser/Thr protein kinase
VSDRDALTVLTYGGGGRDDRCLRIDDLVAMLDGNLDADHSEPLIRHVDRCADCAEMIANLGAVDGPARHIDRYRIERVLGTGGMGIVYAAFDPELQRRVAIKLVRPDTNSERFQARMLDEARALARVSHPNVVGVYDVGEHNGEIFLATELVDGMTLTDWQRTRGRTEIIDAWLQVARGLAAAHAEGVVHRDVKPANIFVGRDGRVRIGDFGIAHLGEAPDNTPLPINTPIPAVGTTTGVVAGTPAYMAPEQKTGRGEARSDQFATCVAIVEALTGERPSANDEVMVPPPALAAVLTRGLRFDPVERFPTMIDFADAVVAAITPPARPRSRKPLLVASGLASALAVVSIVALATRSAGTACTAATVPNTVWAARREALGTALPADAAPAIDRWLRTWSAASADVCTTSHDDEAMRARRDRCLATMLAKLDTLLRGWETAPPRTALAMHIALDELPHAAWCSRAAVAATDEIRATQREEAIALAQRQAKTNRRAAIQTLRAAIAGANDFTKVRVMIVLVGLLGVDQVAATEALVAEARALLAALDNDIALEAELDQQLGQALAGSNRDGDSIAALERALNGVRIAHGEGSPQEASVLITLAGAYYRRDGITSRQGRTAGKAADAIWAKHRIVIPSVVLPASPAEAVEHVKHLQAVAVETSGPSSEAVFDTEYALMNTYVLVEQPDEALVHAKRALELGDRLGLRSSRIPFVRSQLATLLIERGRAKEALPIAHEAVARATDLEVDTELASARSVLGRALIETGDLAAARAPLRASLAYSSSSTRPARQRAHTRFLLAIATRPVDPERAEDEARIARGEITSALDTQELDVALDPIGAPHLRREAEALRARIDRWLQSPAR